MQAKKTKAELQDKDLLRYNRNIVLPEIDIDGQLTLSNSKVAVIGLGGLGCPAATYLASSGIGDICLVDFDSVSLSNLNRQVLFNENNNSISQKISVFPNPLDESSSILLENFGGQETSIDIINILGEKVYNIFEGVIQSDYLEINNLRARIKKDGIYFVRATSSSNKSFTKKIILN